METSCIGNTVVSHESESMITNYLSVLSFFVSAKQNETPIYNLAAGTCLNVKDAKLGATITLDLCSNSGNNKWDLLKTVI